MSPLVTPTAETTPTLLTYHPPTWLKHTPVFMLPYEPFDGPHAGKTDAKYLGFGLAQWRDDEDPHALSIKAWRKPDERWSRQSEELPLHRHVDMTILLAHVLARRDAPTVTLPAGTFTGQQEEIVMQEMAEISFDECARDVELGRERLRKLRDVLNGLDI